MRSSGQFTAGHLETGLLETGVSDMATRLAPLEDDWICWVANQQEVTLILPQGMKGLPETAIPDAADAFKNPSNISNRIASEDVMLH